MAEGVFRRSVRALVGAGDAPDHLFQRAEVFVKAFDTGIVHLTGEVDDLLVLREAGLQDALNAMISGEQKAADVIPDVNRRIQQLLDDFWAKQGRT